MDPIPVRYIQAASKTTRFSNSFGIRTVTNMLAGQDMVQPLHRHDFFYVLVLKKGSGHHEIDFVSFPVDDRVVYIMRPGQVHQLTLHAGSEGYLLHFRHDLYNDQLLRRVSQNNFYQPDAVSFQKLDTLLDYMLQEFTREQEGHEEIIKANLHIFFIELLRQRTNTAQQPGSLYMQERLDEFLQLLETHMPAQKQVAAYAGMLHLSTWQLNAIIKATMGKTCSELINEHIILESKRYLLATSNQVTQIASVLGYEDVSYFIRFFKKHTGYTPDSFRQNFR